MVYILRKPASRSGGLPHSDCPTGTKRSRTRAKLIDAAALVIAERGFDRASLEEIATRAGLTRGAIYGNFKGKDELFLALIEARWKPIVPAFDAGAGLRENLRRFGATVAAEARARRSQAAVATAFQLYTVTNETMRTELTRSNAAAYRRMARALVGIVPESELPMPAERFVRVLDALITGLLFTYFQTPTLITEDVFVSAFEAMSGYVERPPTSSARSARAASAGE